MKESIIRLETDKVLKKRSPEEIQKIISGVEKYRLGLIRELEGLQSAIYLHFIPLSNLSFLTKSPSNGFPTVLLLQLGHACL